MLFELNFPTAQSAARLIKQKIQIPNIRIDAPVSQKQYRPSRDGANILIAQSDIQKVM